MALGLSVAAQDKKWQREDDARTLANAEEIRSVPARLKGAVKEAKVMVKRDEKRAKAMKRVANKNKPVTRTNKKTPLTRATKNRK